MKSYFEPKIALLNPNLGLLGILPRAQYPYLVIIQSKFVPNLVLLDKSAQSFGYAAGLTTIRYRRIEGSIQKQIFYRTDVNMNLSTIEVEQESAAWISNRPTSYQANHLSVGHTRVTIG